MKAGQSNLINVLEVPHGVRMTNDNKRIKGIQTQKYIGATKAEQASLVCTSSKYGLLASNQEASAQKYAASGK